MRVAAQTRTALGRLALAGLALAAGVLGASGALVEAARAGERETERFRSANAALALESQAVLLELYALESRLGRVERRLAGLRAEAATVARRHRAARHHLALVQRTVAEAEIRLGERLRDLYVQGNADPLGVLLGAESLDEALSTLDSLGRFARQDRLVVAHVIRARRDVRRAVRELAARRSELEVLVDEATTVQASLARARHERRSYVARLVAERRVNGAQLPRLRARADAAEAKATDVAAEDASNESTDGSEPSAPASPSPAPAAPADGAGTQMTVLATGYSLSGTTSTGMPVGWGVVAVDPSVIPLGTRLSIPGYGDGVAADTGGAVRGNVIDVWFPTRAQALAWGRRTVTITLH